MTTAAASVVGAALPDAALLAIRQIGGDPDRILEAPRPKGSHQWYIELHIEQGGALARAGIPVGGVKPLAERPHAQGGLRARRSATSWDRTERLTAFSASSD